MKHLHTALIATMTMIGVSTFAIDASKLPPAAARKDITFDKDIKPMFEASCVKCHGEKKPKAGLRLDTLENVLKGGEEGKVIETGNSVKSKLLISVSQLDPETAMPPKPKRRGPGGPGGERRPGGTNAPAGEARGPGGPGGPGGQTPPQPLTPEQVGVVRAWIDQGAK
jgi:hypothetical protein